MLTVVTRGTPEEARRLEEIRNRRAAADAGTEAAARAICAEVKSGGWDAVRRLSLQYDGAEPREIPRAELQAAYERCGSAVIADLEHAARNIRDYQERLIPKGGVWQSPDGAKVGLLARPLRRVGMYVPGGTAAYPSTVLMNAVPAKAAGVEELVMVTPPTRHLRDEVLAAARIAGVDAVYAVGGAQAVAALAYGAGPVPAADKIVGPGNAFVAAAKRLLYGVIDIDMIAGPSEILIIADGGADPRLIAADLLGQAEHNPDSACFLVTDDPALPGRVNAELEIQLSALPRRDIASASLDAYSAAFICADLAACAACSDALAPEHLELLVGDPHALLPAIRNAGAVFIGPWAPETLGDY
ncbi:MAG: histidinol dehydrogenase, partial [Oscillospiraceae bacterium]|nr:histidinol dehydrogenase [Oscillospiraceae bacterium]